MKKASRRTRKENGGENKRNGKQNHEKQSK